MTTRLADPPAPATVDAWHAVEAAVQAHDTPEDPPIDRRDTAGRLLVPALRSRHARFGFVEHGDPLVLAGVAAVRLFLDPANRHAAFLERLAVRPDRRRRGLGTRLWAAVRAELAAEGRTTVSTMATRGGPGGRFAAAHGFTLALPLGFHAMDVPATVTPAPLPDGYRLIEWTGMVPDEHAEALAAAKSAMEDAPAGDLDQRPPAWDAARVREMAEVLLRRDRTLITVAALAPDGTIAALTEMDLPSLTFPRAFQNDTTVDRRHRGKGLGLAVKTRMLAVLRERHPLVQDVLTAVADDNGPMLAVNRALGYRLVRPVGLFQLQVLA